MANRNFASGGKIYSMHVKPVLVDCNFVVDSANGNGLGIRSLKGPLVNNVFMHTSASPGTNNGQTNPNPSTGVILIELNDNYNRYLSGFSGQAMGVGSNTATIVAGSPYIVTSLGTTTQAQWVTAGVAARFQTNNGLPPIGFSFIALASETIPGAPTVAPPVASGIDHIEVLGDPNVSLAPIPSTPGIGGRVMVQCLLNSTATAPADGSVVSLALYLNDSSVLIQGE